MLKGALKPLLSNQQMIEQIESTVGSKLDSIAEYLGDLTMVVPSNSLCEVLQSLRDDNSLRFEMLVSITAVHWPDRKAEFELVYHLRSIVNNLFVVIKTETGLGDAIPTTTHLFKTADWQEREVFDMFGIRFDGHPNLKRILLPEGYPWFPLRKGFPIEGPDFPIDAYQTDAAGLVESDDFWKDST